MTIASLIVNVEANTAKLVKDVEGIQGSLDKVGATATKMGGMLAGAFSVGAIVSFTKSVFDSASNIHDLSSQLGISTDAVQGFKFAAEQSGSSLDAVSSAITKMNKNLVGGDKATVDALKAVGLNFNAIRSMKPEDAFLAIADGIQKLPDPMEQSNVALTLFGKSAAELLPGIKEGFRGLANGATKMSQDNIDALEAAQDSLDAFKNSVTIAAGTIIGDMTRAATHMTSTWGNAAHFLKNLGTSGIWTAIVAEDMEPKIAAQAEAAKKLAAAHQTVHAAYVPLPPIMHKTAEELAAEAKAHEEAVKAVEAHTKAITDLRDSLSGQGAIKAANDMLEALQKSIPIQQMTKDAQDKINKTMDAAMEVYRAQGKVAPQTMRDIYRETLLTTEAIVGLGGAVTQSLGKAFALAYPDVSAYARVLPTVQSGIDNIADALPKISKADIAYQFSKATHAADEFADTLTDKVFGALEDLPSVVLSAFTGGGNAIKGMASHIGSMFGDSMFTKIRDGLHLGVGTIGSMVPAFGAALGAIAPALGSLVSGIFNKIFGTAGRDAVESFAASLGGFDAMHVKLLALGDAGEALWIKLTQGVGRNNPQQAAAVIAEINAALAGQDAWMSRLPGLIEKYGLSWEQAGHQAEQAHLDEIARGLIQDFADLSHAGFDVTLITEKMSTAVNDYVHEAMRTGTEIPAAMKPLLNKMIEMGTLTDLAGDKMTDLGGLSFAETLTEGFKSVVDAIHEMIKALGGDLMGTLDALGKRQITIPVGFAPHWEGEPPSQAATGGFVGMSRVLPFAAGGFVRGTDTVPAMLTPGEIVINAAQQRNLAGAVNGGSMRGLEQKFDELRQEMAAERAFTRTIMPKAIASAVRKAVA